MKNFYKPGDMNFMIVKSWNVADPKPNSLELSLVPLAIHCPSLGLTRHPPHPVR